MWPVPPPPVNSDPRSTTPRGSGQLVGVALPGAIAIQQRQPPQRPPFFQHGQPQSQQRPLSSQQLMVPAMLGGVPGNEEPAAQRHVIQRQQQADHFYHQRLPMQQQHFRLPGYQRQPQQQPAERHPLQPPQQQPPQLASQQSLFPQQVLSPKVSAVRKLPEPATLMSPTQLQRVGDGAWSGAPVVPTIPLQQQQQQEQSLQHQHHQQQQQQHEGALLGPPSNQSIGAPFGAESGLSIPRMASPQNGFDSSKTPPPRGSGRGLLPGQPQLPHHNFHAQAPTPFYGRTSAAFRGQTIAPSHGQALGLTGVTSAPPHPTHLSLHGMPALSMGPFPAPPGLANGGGGSGEGEGGVFSSSNDEPWDDWDMALAEALASDAQVNRAAFTEIHVPMHDGAAPQRTIISKYGVTFATRLERA